MCSGATTPHSGVVAYGSAALVSYFPSVLLVDDDPLVLRVMARTLVARGHAVTTAECAVEALARTGRGHHGVALLDIEMEEAYSGIYLAMRLLLRGNVPRVVFHTASRDVATLRAAEELGAVLAKGTALPDEWWLPSPDS
jgi:CheY-like chemotaxis protein